MKDQELPKEVSFKNLDPWQQRTQSAIWALLFLIGELALTIRLVRDRLKARGALEPEDEELINQACIVPESLTKVYAHMDLAFQEKCNRVFQALSQPMETTQITEEELGEINQKFTASNIKSTALDVVEEEGGPSARPLY